MNAGAVMAASERTSADKTLWNSRVAADTNNDNQMICALNGAIMKIPIRYPFSLWSALLVGTLLSFLVPQRLPGQPGCASPPSGLISWWRGESDASDFAGLNNGTLAGGTAFGAGRVGSGFGFHANGDG